METPDKPTRGEIYERTYLYNEQNELKKSIREYRVIAVRKNFFLGNTVHKEFDQMTEEGWYAILESTDHRKDRVEVQSQNWPVFLPEKPTVGRLTEELPIYTECITYKLKG